MQTKKTSANPRKHKNKFVKNQNKYPKPDLNKPKDNKIKVFTIKRKVETTLIKRTYIVDLSIAIPCSVKGSRGPKQLWVPKSTWSLQVISDE